MGLIQAAVGSVGGVLADACGHLLRGFFAERRAQKKSARDEIPAGEATELTDLPPDAPA